MDLHPFYLLRAWVNLLLLSVLFFAFGMLGYKIGLISRSRAHDLSQIGTVQASMLGLLALILGFTFSAASARFDSRRLLVVDEANALGTTFLRAQALPEPYRTNVSGMLKRYVDLRLQPDIVDGEASLNSRVKRNTEKLQQDMWKQAADVATKKPTPIAAVFLVSLNESIDLYASRKEAFLARVPSVILWILTLIAAVSNGILGYGFGISKRQSWMLLPIVAVLIAAVIDMIVDLDRPQFGPTKVTQQSMIDLRDSISSYMKSEY